MVRHYRSSGTPGDYEAFSLSGKGKKGGRVPGHCPPGFQGRYTVVSGDTMYFIAQRFGVSLEALIAANPQISDPNLIYPGDQLCVPGGPSGGRVPKHCPPGFQARYTVTSGDTIYFIAQRFGVSLDALIAANPQITDPSVIFPGDVLCVPGAAPPCRAPVHCPQGFKGRYTVVAGDTMDKIAHRYGVSLDALVSANPQITDPSMIFPCDVLCVPAASPPYPPPHPPPHPPPTPPGRVPVSCPHGFKGRYTVMAGDTMDKIAHRYGVSLDALVAANPQITDPSVIFPCDVLCVPCAQPGRIPKSCPSGFRGQYTVREGDTMFELAQRYRVSLEALVAANPHISDPKAIFPCDVLCVPCAVKHREK